MAPSARFSDNRGVAPVVVFDGQVALPASPAPTGVPGWTLPTAAVIPFSTAFAYAGGDLCIDIDGVPVSPPAGLRWWVDYDHTAPVGTVSYFGAGCGISAGLVDPTVTATASGRNAVPGGSWRAHSVGRVGAFGSLAVGPALLSPIGLDALGAPGCSLLVNPGIVVPVGVYPNSSVGRPIATLRYDLDVPAQVSLLGGQLSTQWVRVEGTARSNPLGVTTSNAVDVTLASSLPAGVASTVWSGPVSTGPLPDRGAVSVARAPVLALVAQ